MVTVTPLKSFDHNGIKRKGVPFPCSEATANALKRCKLVSFGEEMDANPLEPVAPSSASLPALPSPQTIVKPPAPGAKRGRKKKQ